MLGINNLKDIAKSETGMEPAEGQHLASRFCHARACRPALLTDRAMLGARKRVLRNGYVPECIHNVLDPATFLNRLQGGYICGLRGLVPGSASIGHDLGKCRGDAADDI